MPVPWWVPKLCRYRDEFQDALLHFKWATTSATYKFVFALQRPTFVALQEAEEIAADGDESFFGPSAAEVSDDVMLRQ